MVAANTVQAGTLADVKDEFKTFNAKLRRVLKGKSRKDLAELLGISTGTIGSWLSRGSQPPYYQLAALAKFAGCSLEYLIDDSIPVDADPKQGTASAPLSARELSTRLHQDYLVKSAKLYVRLEAIQGTDWLAVARALLAVDPAEAIPERLRGDLFLIESLSTLVEDTIGPFVSVFNDKNSEPDMRIDALCSRWDGIQKAPTILAIQNLLSVRRSIALAQETGRDTADFLGLIDEIRAKLDTIETADGHLLDVCAGVVEAGGIDAYIDQLWALGAQDMKPEYLDGVASVEALQAKQRSGELPASKAVQDRVMADMERQKSYELNTARSAAELEQEAFDEAAEDLQALERGKRRLAVLNAAFLARIDAEIKRIEDAGE